jgi:hypothetical protein
MCLSDIINERLDLWEGEVNVNHGIVSGRTYLTAEDGVAPLLVRNDSVGQM